MALTLAQLKTVALFGAGRTAATLPAGIDLVALINDAGRQLVSERAWDFRKGATTIAAVASTESIALPSDYGEPISLRGVGGAEYVRLVPLAEITRMREASPVSGWSGTWYVALDGFSTAAGPTTTPTPQADIYPTPTANGQPTLELKYLRAWRTLSSDTDVAAVPVDFEKALRYLVRAEVKRLQNDEDPPELEWYALEVARLSELEGRRSVSVTPVRGGAGEFRQSATRRPPDGGHFVWS